MACIAEFSRASRASRRASRSRTGSSPRCWSSAATTRTRRQVAPHARRGVQPVGLEAAAGRSAAASSASTGSSAARPTSGTPTSSRTTTRSSQPVHARGGLPPVQGPGRQGDRVHPRRQGRSRPTSRCSCTSAPAAATRRTTCSRSGPTSTRAGSTRATRRSEVGSSRARRSSGLLPDGHRAVADQPAR